MLRSVALTLPGAASFAAFFATKNAELSCAEAAAWLNAALRARAAKNVSHAVS